MKLRILGLFGTVFTGLLISQISAPRIGFTRDSSGELRPVYGVAGSFVLGEPVLDGIEEFAFDGKTLTITTEGEVKKFDSDLKEISRERRTEESGIGSVWQVRIEGDEAVVTSTNVRLRLPEAIEKVEQMGEDWMVLTGKQARYAVRTRAGSEQLYQLPGVQQ